jgi:hypothetical protein
MCRAPHRDAHTCVLHSYKPGKRVCCIWPERAQVPNTPAPSNRSACPNSKGRCKILRSNVSQCYQNKHCKQAKDSAAAQRNRYMPADNSDSFSTIGGKHPRLMLVPVQGAVAVAHSQQQDASCTQQPCSCTCSHLDTTLYSLVTQTAYSSDA